VVARLSRPPISYRRERACALHRPGAWKGNGGQRVARVGPLPLAVSSSYTALYMEATFIPGMHSTAHRHPGPEAWYVLTGEQCLETPGHRVIVRSGESGIVPEGPPMMLVGKRLGNPPLR
jgi:quercetin dioxygenase-like cupin family protein